MQPTRRSQWIQVLVVLTLACLLPAPVAAHPGSGIVVDRFGQIYFVDMVSGVWKIDAHGALTHIRGPAFHWMTLDATDRFAATPPLTERIVTLYGPGEATIQRT